MPETENVEIMENVENIEEFVGRGARTGSGKKLVLLALGAAGIAAVGYGITKLIDAKLAARKQAKEQAAAEAPSQNKADVADDSIGNDIYIEDKTK